MPRNPDCLAIRVAGQAFRINHQAMMLQGKSVDLKPLPPEVCAGCGGSDPSFNEAMVEAEVAADGLLKVAVIPLIGSCSQATG